MVDSRLTHISYPSPLLTARLARALQVDSQVQAHLPRPGRMEEPVSRQGGMIDRGIAAKGEHVGR